MSDSRYDDTPISYFEEDMRAIIDGTQFPSRPPKSKMEELLKELNDTIKEGGGGGGTTNYNQLTNKPEINGVTLTGNKSSADLGIPAANSVYTKTETDTLLNAKQDDVGLSSADGTITADGNFVATGDITDGDGNKLSDIEELEPLIPKTYTGNPIIIENALGGPVSSLKTTINAIQDLHGYDKPYVGGAGKNLIEVKAASATINGVAFTNNGDSSFTLDGIATKNTTIRIDQSTYNSADNLKTYNAGTYTFSGASNKFYLVIMQISTWEIVFTSRWQNIITDSIDSTIANCFIYIAFNSGTVFNNETFKLMFEVGPTASAWEPYSNICPISGRTAATLTRSDGDEISEDFTIQLGTTVYGGDVNWDTGVMTVTHVLLVNNTADMDNSEDWPGWRTSGIRQYIGGGINRVFTGQTMNVGTVYGANTTGNDDTLILPKDTYNLSQTEWKALATDVQILVPLATPTTIQLTPTQLQMLKGYNRITIEDGTIELTTLDISKEISEIIETLEDLSETPISISRGGTGNTEGYIRTGRKLNSEVGDCATIEGSYNIASGVSSHAEGTNVTASGRNTHAEGLDTVASGFDAHAEGTSYLDDGTLVQTVASGFAAHAEGTGTTASGNDAHSEGFGSLASGNHSHAGGFMTKAQYTAQQAVGKFNDNKAGNLFEVGNGTDNQHRSNAFEVSATSGISTDNGGTYIRFGKDANGNYGYYEGDDTELHLFGSSGSNANSVRSLSSMISIIPEQEG